MVCAGLAREAGFSVIALTVDYNQRHRVELDAARAIAAELADRHIVLPLDLRAFGGSALTDDIAVPKDGVGEGIPVTYVPARNTIFLSLALGPGRGERRARHFHRRQRARLFGLSRLPAGVRRRVREARQPRDQGGRRGRAVHHPRAAPAHDQGRYRARSAAARARRRRSATAATTRGADGRHCGRCDACRLRAKGFAEAGLDDPTAYA